MLKIQNNNNLLQKYKWMKMFVWCLFGYYFMLKPRNYKIKEGSIHYTQTIDNYAAK